MIYKLARQPSGQLQHHQALHDDRTETERTIALVFAREWLELNTLLTVEDSYACQDEMEQESDIGGKLAVVRMWRGRYDQGRLSEVYERQNELRAKIAEIQAKLDGKRAQEENNDVKNSWTHHFYIWLWTQDLADARAELAALL